jgi:GNAT superfamily N-acetyltransferase
MPLEIVVPDAPTPAEREAILAPLVAYNTDKAGPSGHKPIAVLLRDRDSGQTVGGLWASVSYRWLHIDLLFVPEALRGRDLGTELMRRAEAVALANDCVGIRLDTHTFQAPDFYRKLGYEIFGVLDDNPPGTRRFFLHKRLSSGGPSTNSSGR